MSDGGSLINIGELAKPASLLIEKISEAIGGAMRPRQIRRVAEAEADAAVILAKADIEISALQRRALGRFLLEEGVRQANIEKVTELAIRELEDDADPSKVDNDWIASFFEKARLVSDEDMQLLWSKLLAGEANSPGMFSKRCISTVASFDKTDAETFRRFCSFVWMLGKPTALVRGYLRDPYISHGISFDQLLHLDSLGLLTFSPDSGYIRTGVSGVVLVSYYGQPILLHETKKHDIDLGNVLLTDVGEQLARIAGGEPHVAYQESVVDFWTKRGLRPASPVDWEARSSAQPTPPA